MNQVNFAIFYYRFCKKEVRRLPRMDGEFCELIAFSIDTSGKNKTSFFLVLISFSKKKNITFCFSRKNTFQTRFHVL